MSADRVEGRVAEVRFCPTPGSSYFSILLDSEVGGDGKEPNWRLLETLSYSFNGERLTGWGVIEKLARLMSPLSTTPGSMPRVVLTADPHSYVPYKSAEFFSEQPGA